MKNLNETKNSKLAELAAVGIFSAMLAITPAHADDDKGGLQGGGGDTKTEGRIDDIRNDILQWIAQGGAKKMKFEDGLTYEVYVPSMNQVLAKQAVVVSAIATAQEKQDDEELNTTVAGQPKTCKGFISQKDSLPHILCNVERFAKTSESDQYRLVHHEYAGLARVEKNIGAASDYVLSNQITDSLVPMTVLRLAVKPLDSFEHSSDSILVVNQTYPQERLLFQCVGPECLSLNVTHTAAIDGKESKKVIDVKYLQMKLKEKLKERDNCEQEGCEANNYSIYDLTDALITGGRKDRIDGMQDNWKEGREVIAILRALTLVASIPVDTISLPFTVPNHFFKTRADRKMHHRASRVLNVMRRGKDFGLKDHRFQKLVNAVSSF